MSVRPGGSGRFRRPCSVTVWPELVPEEPAHLDWPPRRRKAALPGPPVKAVHSARSAVADCKRGGEGPGCGEAGVPGLPRIRRPSPERSRGAGGGGPPPVPPGKAREGREGNVRPGTAGITVWWSRMSSAVAKGVVPEGRWLIPGWALQWAAPSWPPCNRGSSRGSMGWAGSADDRKPPSGEKKDWGLILHRPKRPVQVDSPGWCRPGGRFPTPFSGRMGYHPLSPDPDGSIPDPPDQHGSGRGPCKPGGHRSSSSPSAGWPSPGLVEDPRVPGISPLQHRIQPCEIQRASHSSGKGSLLSIGIAVRIQEAETGENCFTPATHLWPPRGGGSHGKKGAPVGPEAVWVAHRAAPNAPVQAGTARWGLSESFQQSSTSKQLYRISAPHVETI